MKISVLLLDDSATDRELLSYSVGSALEREGAQPNFVPVSTLEEAKGELDRMNFDFVLLDFNLLGSGGERLSEEFAETILVRTGIPYARVTGNIDALRAYTKFPGLGQFDKSALLRDSPVRELARLIIKAVRNAS